MARVAGRSGRAAPGAKAGQDEPGQPDGNVDRLARGSVLNLVGAVSAGVFGVLLVTIVAALYAPPVAGAFFAAMSVFVVLSTSCELGSEAGLVRWVARYLARGHPGDARTCLHIAIGPVVAAGCLAGGGLFLAAPWAADLISTGTPAAPITSMLRIMAAFLPVAAVRNALLAATRGYSAMRPTVVVEKLGRTAGQVGGVLAAQALGAGATGLALAWSLPYLAGMGAAAWWLRAITRRGHDPRARMPVTRPARAIAAEFWRYTAMRALGHTCQITLQRADIFLVAALGSPAEAAIYTVATRFIVIGQLGAQAVQQIMQPTISHLLAVADRDGAARVLRTATAWIVAGTLPVYLAVATAAPLYLAIVGDDYVLAGRTAVVILAAAMVVAAASGPVDVVLLMAGRSGLSLLNNAIALVTNLALNVALIPALGVTGAAIAWAAAIVARNLLPLGQVRALLRLSPAGRGAALAAAGAVACFGLAPLALRLVAGLDGALLGLAFLPCTAAYGVLMWLLRERIALTSIAGLLWRKRAAGGFSSGG